MCRMEGGLGNSSGSDRAMLEERLYLGHMESVAMAKPRAQKGTARTAQTTNQKKYPMCKHHALDTEKLGAYVYM